MELFENTKINGVETAKNVRKFFNEDFDHYLNLANKHRSDISSPTMDASGIMSHDGINHKDMQMAVNLDAQACVDAVNHTISSCSYDHAIIIYLSFIKQLTDYTIYRRLGYQSARYYQIKTDALIEFAERLDYWRKMNHSSIEDLRIFEK